MQALIMLLMTWPAVAVAIFLGISGVILRKWPIVLAGALLAGPFFLYLTFSPGLRVIAPFVRALYVSVTAAVAWNEKARSRTRQLVAWALLLPSVALVLWLSAVTYGSSGRFSG